MPPKFKRKLSKFLPFIKIFIVFIIIINFIIFIRQTKNRINPIFWWQIVFNDPLKQTNGVTNVLLLGVAGGTHEGADLTDAMILVSFNRQTKKTFLISLPRDIWSPTLQAKINTAYHYGQERESGGGFILAKATATEVTGLPVHYAVKLDLSGLQKIVDLLGGVQINVENSFDDDEFPIEGKENDLCNGDPKFACRYTRIHFDKGLQILNGERALQYIRSRKAQGEEGTDFARNKRQQNLMMALKNKLLSREVLLNPQIISSLPKILDDLSETDLPEDRLQYLWKPASLLLFSKLETVHFDNFLLNPPEKQYGQWVLIPKTEDFAEIHQYLRQKLQ